MMLSVIRWSIPLVIAVVAYTLTHRRQNRRQNRIQNAHRLAEIIPKCEICQRSLEEQGEEKGKLRCGHIFHKQCITVVFDNQDLLVCPIRHCRRTFTSNVLFYQQ